MLYFTLLYFAELTCCGSGAAPLERVRAEFAPKTLLYSRFTIRAAAAAARSSGSGAAPLQRGRAEEGGGRERLCGGYMCGRAAGARRAGRRSRRGAAGTQFTSFTSTNVQVLTAEERRALQEAEAALLVFDALRY